MNPRFYTSARADVRVRTVSVPGLARGPIEARGGRTCSRPDGSEAVHAYSVLAVRLPSAIAALLSMLYGGRYAAATPDDCVGTASHAFSSAVAALARLWSEGAAYSGFESNAFAGSLADCVTVLIALPFGFFAGIGAVVVCAFRLVFPS